MLLLSFIPAIIFIGFAAISEIIFDFIYDHSQKLKAWADREIYQSEESK